MCWKVQPGFSCFSSGEKRREAGESKRQWPILAAQPSTPCSALSYLSNIPPPLVFLPLKRYDAWPSVLQWEAVWPLQGWAAGGRQRAVATLTTPYLLVHIVPEAVIVPCRKQRERGVQAKASQFVRWYAHTLPVPTLPSLKRSLCSLSPFEAAVGTSSGRNTASSCGFAACPRAAPPDPVDCFAPTL